MGCRSTQNLEKTLRRSARDHLEHLTLSPIAFAMTLSSSYFPAEGPEIRRFVVQAFRSWLSHRAYFTMRQTHLGREVILIVKRGSRPPSSRLGQVRRTRICRPLMTDGIARASTFRKPLLRHGSCNSVREAWASELESSRNRVPLRNQWSSGSILSRRNSDCMNVAVH